MLGGVAFDLPKHSDPIEQAEKDRNFRLFGSREEIEERSYQIKRYFLMFFDQNVRGLVNGAPVEVRGIRVGEVVDVKLEVDLDNATARVAVLVLVEPERIDTIVEGEKFTNGSSKSAAIERAVGSIVKLVDKGLRAQLKTGNLLTGQLYVDLDLYPDVEPARIEELNGYKVLPTLPAPFEQMTQRVNNILKKVEKMPIEEISKDLHQSIKSLNKTLQAAEKVAGGIDSEVLPGLKEALTEFQETMNGIQQTLGPDSAINYNARNVMGEMEATIRSLRALIDYMERNPEAILFGKEEDQR
jgi:paraquat-inducible protein B